MAKQVVGIGSTPNDGTGDTLRVGADKINDNFDELYTALGDGSALGSIQQQPVEGPFVDGDKTKLDSALQSVTGTTDEVVVTGGDTISLASAVTASLALADSAIQPTDTASDTVSGVVELATTVETTTGTDTGRAVTPDGLAGSIFGTQVVQLLVFNDSQDVATGDGAGDLFFRVPSTMNGMNLVSVSASVQTAGTTGTTDIQVHNVTQAADMLSTVITIDSGETDSITAATAPVIDTANDDVATGDQIRVDVDAVSTTAPKGLLVELQFQVA